MVAAASTSTTPIETVQQPISYGCEFPAIPFRSVG